MPLALVPIRLPWIVTALSPVTANTSTRMPSPSVDGPLPEITLPAPVPGVAVRPPITVLVAWTTLMPK